MESFLQRCQAELDDLTRIANDIRQKYEYQRKQLQQFKEELDKISELKRSTQTLASSSMFFPRHLTIFYCHCFIS